MARLERQAQVDSLPEVRWVIRLPFRSSAFIGLHILEKTMKARMGRSISAHAYPFVIGVVALILTVSMMIPVAPFLIATILLRRNRWVEIIFLSSFGSAIGGVVLYLIFHHLGWEQITAAYPDLTQSKAWADATRWVSGYGTWALLGIAAMPVPQTPALIFTAISRLPVSEVFLALVLGKLLKYGVYGLLAAKFPSWFQHVIPIGWHKQAL